jgi:hypothetical protein
MTPEDIRSLARAALAEAVRADEELRLLALRAVYLPSGPERRALEAVVDVLRCKVRRFKQWQGALEEAAADLEEPT